MSLRSKKTKWRKKAIQLGSELTKQINNAHPSARLKLIVDELNKHAAHFYKLGRAAGIAEGRRRVKDEQSKRPNGSSSASEQ